MSLGLFRSYLYPMFVHLTLPNSHSNSYGKTLLSSAPRRLPFLNNFRRLRLPESFDRARKVPPSSLRRHAHRPRPHYHSLLVIIHFFLAAFIIFLAFFTLVRPEHRPNRRVAPIPRHRRKFPAGFSVSGEPRTEERNRDGSRSPEIVRLLVVVNEARQGAGFAGRSVRHRRRGRGRRGVGRAAGAGAHVGAVGAEGDEAVVQADGADPVAGPLPGRVFKTLPHLLLFVPVKRH